MPGGHTKFSGSWLSYHDSNGQKLSEWCKKGKDDYNGYCCLCKVDIKCDNAGKAQLLQHAKRKKHTEVIKHMQSVKQSKLLFSHSQASSSSQGGPSSSQGGPSSSQGGPSSCQSEHGEATQEQSLSTSKSSSVATLSGFVYYDDASLKAEIYWLAKVACSNYSLHSCDHVGDMFRAMFQDSKIAAHFSLSRTSSSYIISEGLSSYFTKVIIDDLQRSKLPFSIHFDETSTSQVKKQMDLTLSTGLQPMKRSGLCSTHHCFLGMQQQT